MNDEVRIIKNSLLSYASRGVAAMVGIALVPYLLRHLQEERYGVIGIAQSILGFAALIQFGLRPAASRQYTRFLFLGEIERSNELLSTALAIYAGMACIVVLGLSTGANAFIALMRVPTALVSEANLTLVIISLSLAVTMLAAPYGAALTSQLRHDIQHYTDLIGTVLRAVVIVAIFTLWEPRLFVWALAALIASSVAFLILRSRVHRICSALKLHPSLVTRRGVSDLTVFGLKISTLHFAAWVDSGSGPLIISVFLGAAAVSHFSPASVLVLSLLPLTNAFLFQVQPVATKAHAAADFRMLRRLLLRSTRYSLLVGGGATVLVGSLAFPLVRAWLGKGFHDTVQVLIILCAASLLQAAVGGAIPLFVACDRLRPVVLINIALALLSTAVSIALVGWTPLGLLGAAVGTLVAQATRTIVYAIYSSRICRVDGSEYLLQGLAGPLLSLAALASVSVLLQRLIHAAPLVELSLVAIASLFTYAVLTWKIGLSREDRVKALSYGQRAWAHALNILHRRPSGSTETRQD